MASKADQVLAALREPRWRSIDRIGPHNEAHRRAYLDCGHYVCVTKFWASIALDYPGQYPYNCPKCP